LYVYSILTLQCTVKFERAMYCGA